MNLFDSSFLCLDIGTNGVRGIAHRVRNGRIDNYAIYSVDNSDTVYALKAVVDELEQKIGRRFDSAYITGNFGMAQFYMKKHETIWNTEHKITLSDIRAQISQIHGPENFYPMHIIPLQYNVLGTTNLKTPVGQTDRKLTSLFSAIFYDRARLSEIQSILRRAHIQAEYFMDPQFLQNATLRTENQRMMFIDLGHEFTTASIWTPRGPMWFVRIPHGGANINADIAKTLNIDISDADRIKRTVSSMIPSEMDRFTPADTSYEFSRADVNDIIIPHIVDIIAQIKESGDAAISKYKPSRIILTGGGAEISDITKFFENTFSISVQNMRGTASVMALSKYIWSGESEHVAAYFARQEKWKNIKNKISKIFKHKRAPRKRFIPIMPSTLCFNMRRPETYTLFTAGGISMIHIDIMDGLYVNKIASGASDVRFIREHTNAHLHVHLMTESPDVIAADVIAAGADTVIVSTKTSGVIRAINLIHNSGRRAGVALNPDNKVSMLHSVIADLDEVMVMTVTPGAAGQDFDTECVKKITELNELRRTRNLKFKISVDGGITDKTAQMCWAAGADFLVSGSYLARSSDFPLAVQSLLPGANNKY